MGYKRYLIFLVLLIMIISLSLSLTELTSISDVLLDVTGISPIKKEKDTILATESLITKKEKVQLNLEKENTCYWLKTVKNKTSYLLEISEYEYTSDMKGCFGYPKDVKYIILDKPLNLMGISCLCTGNDYDLEWKNGLKITKLNKPLFTLFGESTSTSTTTVSITAVEKNRIL